MAAKITYELSMLARNACFFVNCGDDLYKIKRMVAERALSATTFDQHDHRLAEALSMSNLSNAELKKFLY